MVKFLSNGRLAKVSAALLRLRLISPTRLKSTVCRVVLGMRVRKKLVVGRRLCLLTVRMSGMIAVPILL